MSEIEVNETPAATWNEAMQASAQQAHEESHPPRAFTELLPVKLTVAELAERAKKAAAARHRIADFEVQKKAAADTWKAKIELAENERDGLLDAIASGSEEREVEVVETFEFRTGIVTVTRTDTGDVIRERAMSALERQPELPGTAMTQTTLDDAPRIHDGDEVDEPTEGDETVIDDPEAVMADADEAPAARVIRRRKKA